MAKYERKTVKKIPMDNPDRLGALSPREFEQTASEALGGRGWQKAFIHGTGLSQSTITRYLQGILPIPRYVAVIVQMLATLRRNNLPVPDAFNLDSP